MREEGREKGGRRRREAMMEERDDRREGQKREVKEVRGEEE